MNRSYLYAGGAIMFWSTVAVIVKLLLGGVNSFQVLWISSLFAFLALLIFNVLTKNIKNLKNYKPKDYLISILIGIPGTFLYYVFYYTGTSMMAASQAFIINYLWPIMSVVFVCVFLKEKLTARQIVAISISFLGVVVVMGKELLSFNQNTLFGALFCMTAAVCYGLFTGLNLKFNYDKRISMMLNYITTFVLTTIINTVSGDLFIPSLLQTVGFAWNGAMTMAASATLWFFALQTGKAAKISNLAYITPFLSLVWTSLILKEPITIYSVFGLMLIVFGILIQLRKNEK